MVAANCHNCNVNLADCNVMCIPAIGAGNTLSSPGYGQVATQQLGGSVYKWPLVAEPKVTPEQLLYRLSPLC